MHKSISGLLVVALIGGAFYAGRVTAPQSTHQSVEAEDKKWHRTHRGRQVSRTEYDSSPISPRQLSKPGGIVNGLEFALDENDPFLRSARLFEVLESLTAENWEEALKGTARSNGETGRTINNHYRDILVRIGQVAGPEAMGDKVDLSKLRGARESVLYGWATKDPEAAIEWLRNNADENPDDPNKFWGPTIAGVTRTNPERGKEILANLPDADWKDSLKDFVKDLIRGETLTGTDDWLSDVMKSERSDELKKLAIQKVYPSLSQATSNLRDPGLVAKWYQDFGSFADGDSNRIALNLVRTAARRDGTNSADLLIRLQDQGLEIASQEWDYFAHSIPSDRIEEFQRTLRPSSKTEFEEALARKENR